MTKTLVVTDSHGVCCVATDPHGVCHEIASWSFAGTGGHIRYDDVDDVDVVNATCGASFAWPLGLSETCGASFAWPLGLSEAWERGPVTCIACVARASRA